MKACNQCEHYWSGFGRFRHRCGRPTAEISPITGDPYGISSPCYRQRSESWLPWVDRCGPDAKYHEAKPLKTLGDG